MQKLTVLISLSFLWWGLSLSSLSFSSGSPANSQNGLEKFIQTAPTSECKTRLRQIDKFPLVWESRFFQYLLKEGKHNPEFNKELAEWSADLLVHLIVQIEQHFLSICPNPVVMRRLANTLKRIYLHGFKIHDDKMDDGLIDNLFRGLIAPKEEHPALRERILSVSPLPDKKPLAAIFGSVSDLRNVPIVSASAFDTKKLESLLKELCGGNPHCRFWNPISLFKVAVTAKEGVASYIPETATLALSQSLVVEMNALHKLVLVHELSHVAVRSALVQDMKDWKKEFSDFSGWDLLLDGRFKFIPEKHAKSRQDDYVTLSQNSPYSILPDPVFLPARSKEKNLDGFTFAKSYYLSLQRKDPEEDLADHVAAFFLSPQRFCFDNKTVAPQKFRWIAQTVFGKPAELHCSNP